MKVRFQASFLKDIEALGDRAVRGRVREAIVQAEQAAALQDIWNLKKLRSHDQYYRMRVGDYRLGLVLEKDTIVFIRCLHRKDIYRYFGKS